jgi:hypothetical protein
MIALTKLKIQSSNEPTPFSTSKAQLENLIEVSGGIYPDFNEKQVYHDFADGDSLDMKPDFYQLRLEADKDCNLICTQKELEYFNSNKDKIKRHISRSLGIEERRNLTPSSEILGYNRRR